MAKVIGVKPTIFDFSDKDGRPVHSEGVTFFMSFPQKDTEGLACEKVYLAYSKIESMPSVGDEVEVTYNRFGKANGIKVLA